MTHKNITGNKNKKKEKKKKTLHIANTNCKNNIVLKNNQNNLMRIEYHV